MAGWAHKLKSHWSFTDALVPQSRLCWLHLCSQLTNSFSSCFSLCTPPAPLPNCFVTHLCSTFYAVSGFIIIVLDDYSVLYAWGSLLLLSLSWNFMYAHERKARCAPILHQLPDIFNLTQWWTADNHDCFYSWIPPESHTLSAELQVITTEQELIGCLYW